MLDILVRDGDSWLAVEVKSSLRLSDTYYNDAALQYYVLKGCGVPLSDFRLMYLNGDYVKNGPIDVQQLFKMESVMEYVVDREGYVAKNVERLKAVVALPHAPLVDIGTQCNAPYPCDFQGHCWKHVPKNSFLFTTALDDETLFHDYFNGVNTNAKMLQQLDPDSEETRQIEALETNSYHIDYKTLVKRCHEDMRVAFSMHPTSIDELFAVADQGRLMPPKSTWFEPKLLSGMFIHAFS